MWEGERDGGSYGGRDIDFNKVARTIAGTGKFEICRVGQQAINSGKS